VFCFCWQPGDCSHVNVSNEQFLQSIVIEEDGKESFTAVVITGVQPDHVTYLKQYFNLWTRELAYVPKTHTQNHTTLFWPFIYMRVVFWGLKTQVFRKRYPHHLCKLQKLKFVNL